MIDGKSIEVIHMNSDELNRIADIDRAENITRIYRHEKESLTPLDVDHQVPNWALHGDGEHTVNYQIAFCRSHLEEGAQMLGVFDGELLVGIGLVRSSFREGMAHLPFMHVSRAYRRQGIAGRLFKEAVEISRAAGASAMYISATPSESALGFYFAQGCELANEVDPELYDLEPEDIHLILKL